MPETDIEDVELQQSASIRAHTNLVLDLTTDAESSTLDLPQSSNGKSSCCEHDRDAKTPKDDTHPGLASSDVITKKEKVLKAGRPTDQHGANVSPAVASSLAQRSEQSTPGAVRVRGVDPSSEFHPDRESFSVQDAMAAEKLSETVTAVVVEPGVLEAEIRQQIISETVSASHVEQTEATPFWKRTAVLLPMGCIIAVLLVVAVAVGVTILVQSDDPSGSQESSPEDQEMSLLDYLKAISYDNGATLENTTSPQYRAYEWLLDDPIVDGGNEEVFHRYALAVMYYSLGGEGWTKNNGWLSRRPTCEWFSDDAEACTPNTGTLTRLSLPSNNLRGTIPIEIGYMNIALRHLDLSGNSISGTIPSQLISLLLTLEELNLDGNNLTGGLDGRKIVRLGHPEEEAGLPTKHRTPAEKKTDGVLQILTLGNNELSGTLPMWRGNLKGLKRLALHSNAFTGPLPVELATLEELLVLRVENNRLNGTIPGSVVGSWAAISRSYLEGNDFSGNMPTSICDQKPSRLSVDCEEVTCSCCTHCCVDRECDRVGL